MPQYMRLSHTRYDTTIHVGISHELEGKKRVKGNLKKMITTHDNLPIAHNVG